MNHQDSPGMSSDTPKPKLDTPTAIDKLATAVVELSKTIARGINVFEKSQRGKPRG